MAKNMMITFIILFSLTWNHISGQYEYGYEYNYGVNKPPATFGTNLDHHKDFNTNSTDEEAQELNSSENEVIPSFTFGMDLDDMDFKTNSKYEEARESIKRFENECEYNNGNDKPSATFGTNLDHRDFNTNNSKYEESQRYSNSLKNEVSINGRHDVVLHNTRHVNNQNSTYDPMESCLWCLKNYLKYCEGDYCNNIICQNCPELSCPRRGRVPQPQDMKGFPFIQISGLIMIIVLCWFLLIPIARRQKQNQRRYSNLLIQQNQDQRGENNDFRTTVSDGSHCTVDLNSGLNHERDLPPSYYECRNQSIDGSTIKPDQHCSSRYTDLQTDRNQSIITSSSNGNQQQAMNAAYSCFTVNNGWESHPSYGEYLSSFKTANS